MADLTIYQISTSILKDIADAIRSKLKTSNYYSPNTMAEAINSIKVRDGTSAIEPLYYDYNIGYIAAGKWTYENPTQTYTDIYPAIKDHTYIIALGGTVGTRFRTMWTDVDVTQLSSGNVIGTQGVNLNNPPPYSYSKITASDDGYILVAKDNIGQSGLKSFVFDMNTFEDE